MTFEEARAQFPVLERYAYLNAGTTGPLARATVEALEEQAERDLREGRKREGVLRASASRCAGKRVRASPMYSVSNRPHIAVVDSTSRACGTVLGGLGSPQRTR